MSRWQIASIEGRLSNSGWRRPATTMIKSNFNPLAFFERPIAAFLGVATLVILL